MPTFKIQKNQIKIYVFTIFSVKLIENSVFFAAKNAKKTQNLFCV